MSQTIAAVTRSSILEHLLRNAAAAGLREFVIAIGYLGEDIRSCFGSGSRSG